VIRPGEVNWMTAGRGITHSERFEDLRAHGGTMHGIQAWVALPAEAEEVAPAFAHHGAEDLPTYESPDGKLWARLVAGRAFGTEAKVKTHSPMFYIHWALKAGAQADIAPEYPERAAYVAQGVVEVDGRQLNAGQMAILTPGQHVVFTAQTDAIVMLLGGEPVGERFIEWNFVASSKDCIAQAKADWRAGRMKLPDADDQEFIPLPPDPPGPAPAMS
jgi:redox-sensitive bicupin YhaK (pirin superfamily)